MPTTQSLTGAFAPTSDQAWLTIGTAANGVVPFTFIANPDTSNRTAQVTILGVVVAVTQAGATPTAVTVTTSVGTVVYGQAVTLTATVSAGSGAAAPTGTVEFFDTTTGAYGVPRE